MSASRSVTGTAGGNKLGIESSTGDASIKDISSNSFRSKVGVGNFGFLGGVLELLVEALVAETWASFCACLSLLSFLSSEISPNLNRSALKICLQTFLVYQRNLFCAFCLRFY